MNYTLKAILAAQTLPIWFICALWFDLVTGADQPVQIFAPLNALR